LIELLDGLTKTVVGELSVLLDKASMKHQDIARRGQGLELVEEPGLTDTWLAGNSDELALALDRCVEPLLQLLELLLAADER
jgi:hypothetical protein